MYSLSNLECLTGRKMIKHNGLDNWQCNLVRGGKSFTDDLTLLQLNNLKKLLINKTYTIKFLASRYEVSEMAIYRAKRRLLKCD